MANNDQSDTADRAERLLAHAEGSISEDDIVAAARERAMDSGAGAVTPAVGALLSLLARLSGAERSWRSAQVPVSAAYGCCRACATTGC